MWFIVVRVSKAEISIRNHDQRRLQPHGKKINYFPVRAKLLVTKDCPKHGVTTKQKKIFLSQVNVKPDFVKGFSRAQILDHHRQEFFKFGEFLNALDFDSHILIKKWMLEQVAMQVNLQQVTSVAAYES